MTKSIIIKSIMRVQDASFSLSIYVGRFFVDHNYLDVTPPHAASERVHQIAALANKAKTSIQQASFRAFSQKITTGDIAPKPTTKMFIYAAEGLPQLMSKATPLVSKMASSHAGLVTAIAAGGLMILTDDTTRNLMMDQLSQMIAIFQSENGTVQKTADDKVELNLDSEASTATQKPLRYNHPNYYL